MSTDVDVSSSVEILNNYNTLTFEVNDEGVVLVLEYLSDNWDDIRNDRSEDLIALLESNLKKLQSSQCLGRHPIRYSKTRRQTPMCDLIYVVVSLVLINKEEMEEEISALLTRFSPPQNILTIPPEEITELRKKLGKSKKIAYSAPTIKHRWRL